MPIKQTKLWKFFSSIKLAIWLLSIIAVFSLIGSFIPQNEEAGFYIEKYGHTGYKALLKTGFNNIYASWYFLLSLALLALNLCVCLLNRFSLRVRALGSTMSHLSILVILFGALIGMSFGQKGFIRISKGEEVNSFLNRNKEKIGLGFSIRLNEFIYSENIDPKEKLLVFACKNGDFCKLHPAGQDKNQKLIAQIPTETGSESEIADTGYKVKVLRYLPDFVMDTATKAAQSRSAIPNNPAIEVELKDKEGKARAFWVFARFPDMHQEINADFKFIYNWVGRRPKDFISEVAVLQDGKEIISKDIRVNDPLRFGGYTFFQSSYDSEALSWSGLQVAKDPGVPVVYAGFVMLIAGLTIIFYVNPLLKKG